MKDPINKLNELKYSCVNEIKVASRVHFLVLDIRYLKKPRID